MSWDSKKMLPKIKSKKSTKSLQRNFTLIKKMVIPKNSKNSLKPIKRFQIPKNAECTTSTALKEPEVEDQANKISSTCSSEEEAEAEAPQPKSKSPSANPPKLALKSHLLIFTMAKSSSTNITEPDAAKNAMVKEVKMLKHANSARVKAWSFKCTKWDQECISKFRKIATSAKEKEK
jgi:hypothetical protein